MIDIHCHILPETDDGAASLTESLAMAETAANQGIRQIIATPHENGQVTNEAEAIQTAVQDLNERLKQENIPVDVLPGQEIMMYEGMVQDLIDGTLLPLNKTSGYVLLALPDDHIPSYTTDLLFDLQIAGYKPIIAQPELNTELLDQPDTLYRMVKNGALTQVAAASVAGKAGRGTRRFAYQLIEANLTHFIASNAHNKKKGFYMDLAYDRVKKTHGNVMVYQLMENSEALAVGKAIYAEAPKRIKTNRLWDAFKG